MTQATATRRMLAATALVCGAGLLAACGSPAGSPGSSPATVTVTASPSSPSATPGGSGAAGGSGGSAAAGGTAAGPSCATSVLKIHLGSSNGAAGSSYVPIQFINTSGAACTLYGFPGVSFVSGVGGSQIGASAGENKTAARKVITLRPGGEAHALLQVVVAQNFPAATCKPVTAHWLKVYPPGQTSPKYLDFTSPTCSSASKTVRVLNVQTVQPGDGNP